MKQYIILFLSLITTISYSQDKAIHLAHGLGGETDSWTQFDNFLQSQCSGIETSRFEMASVNGMAAYSSEFEGYLNGIGADENDIAIGHSFGGINLRNMDNLGTSSFGGYITVATPNQGALLANNSENGQLNDFFNSGCRELVTEPSAAILKILPYSAFVAHFLSTIIENNKEPICDFFYEALLDKAAEYIGDGTTISELGINGTAPKLPASTLPSIGVVCAVDGNPLWSLLADYKNDDINLSNIENTMNNVERSYNGGSNILNVLATLHFFKPTGIRLRNAANELEDGVQWLEATDFAWSTLIGAGGIVDWNQQAEENWICHCYDYQQGIPVPCDIETNMTTNIELLEGGQICDDNPSCWETSLSSFPVFGPITPSDGILPIENQSLPGSIHEEFINDVSHFAQPGDPGVHTVLLEQLTPTFSPNPFFNVNNCL